MSAETVIVGGGVSGLAAAYFLGRQGISCTIFEKENRLGGLIKTDLIETDLVEGCRLEAGPDSFIAAKPAVMELAQELDALTNDVIESNDAARRVFIWRNGKLVPMPRGMVMMVPGAWGPALRSSLFSVPTKLRLFTEQLARPRERAEDISVGKFVRDHFGSEILDYVTEPLLCGVYGGSSEHLSAASVLPRFVGYEQKYGSLIRGVHAEAGKPATGGTLFRSFGNGMQQLTDALEAAIQANSRVIHAEVTAVFRTEDGWRIEAGAHSLRASTLVLACPAHVCGKLLQNAAPELAAELVGIPYSSAILVTLVFDRRELDHPLDGFGFLVPEKERRTVAAATWINTKFPSRVPPNLAALRAFIVGAQAQERIAEPERNLLETVKDEFRRIMGVQAMPLYSSIYKWPKSMPQYVVGHAARVRNIREQVAQMPGLELVGNAFDGVGIPDCVRLAKDAAGRIFTRSRNSPC